MCPNLMPDEIWISIFTFIPDNHHEALSLVCKHFLILTNHLKRTLHLLPSYPTQNILPTLLHRFTHLRSIHASAHLDTLLYLISRSRLPIHEISLSNQTRLPVHILARFRDCLTELRVLKCSKIRILRGDDLVAVSVALPWLRDLDISYPESDCDSIRVMRTRKANLSDAGIEEMSMKLPDLVKINLSGNPFISDRAIVALATNCVMLREIVALDCCFVTQIGIVDAMRKNPNLTSVSVSGVELAYSIRDSIWSRSSMSALHFSYSFISDEFLCSMVEARLPLKQLTISHCFGFNLVGISALISAYQSLTYVNLERVECLTDGAMAGLAKLLPSLISVNLNGCSTVGNLTLFAIIKFCRCIEQILMERTSLGKGWVPADALFSVNQNIRSLKVARNSLANECAVRIASACPNLEVLDLSQCREITVTGITGILYSCKEIRHLGLNHLTIGDLMKWDKCKVEVLEMKGLLGLNDDQLDVISNMCPNLLCVDLSSCLNLSTSAVKRLVKRCTNLREMKLDWYEEMSFGNLASMVFQRRSLRKVVFSSKRSTDLLLSAKQKDVLLRHGCQIVQC
ncbi:hypothetical protein QQ045_008401 [Rhodiola kirilowii]